MSVSSSDFRAVLGRWGLAALSVLFFSLPYLVPGTGVLMLLAWVPLLVLDRYWYESGRRRCWWKYYLVFLLWNLATTWWIYHATLPGAVAAVLLNALQMSLVFWLFRVFRRKTEQVRGGNRFRFLPYLFLTALWIAWEHLYFNAQVSWPWLVLGNAFAGSVRLVQWYEVTGSLGGSLWSLFSGIFLFRLLALYALPFFAGDRPAGRERAAWVAGTLIWLLVPPAVSLWRYATYREKENPREFVVLQPNIEPYEAKFKGMGRDQQDSVLLALAASRTTGTTDFLVAPETFTSYVDEDHIGSSPTARRVAGFLECYPSANFIYGAVTLRYYPWDRYPGSTRERRPTETARAGQGYWYDAYNAALLTDSSGRYEVFHKSKLVVLAEFLPFPRLLSAFGNLALELGGTVSSYGTQPEITIFRANDGTGIGTAICYESVYGDYCRGYVQRGAQVMTVITNDGWWGDTPGYRQHLSYSRLRAVELRRSIARSANTGISALINQRGDVVAKTAWWEADALRGSLNLNDRQTFFVRYGDLVGRVSLFLSGLLLLYLFSSVLAGLAGREQRSSR